MRLLNANQQRNEIDEVEKKDKKKIDFTNLRALARSITRNHTRLVRNLLLLRMLKRPTEDCLPVGTNIDIEPPLSSALNPIEQATYDAIFDDPFFTASEKILLMRRICMHDNRDNPKFKSPGTGEAKYTELCSSIDEFLGELKENQDTHSGKILVASTGHAGE